MAEDRALYVSAKEGHHVTRFGTKTLIGCEIDLSHPGNIRWNEQAIVAIPEAEYLTYKAEYDRLIADGALVKQKPAAYAAFLKSRDEKIEKAATEAEAAAAKVAVTKPDPVEVDLDLEPEEAKQIWGRKPEER